MWNSGTASFNCFYSELHSNIRLTLHFLACKSPPEICRLELSEGSYQNPRREHIPSLLHGECVKSEQEGQCEDSYTNPENSVFLS